MSTCKCTEHSTYSKGQDSKIYKLNGKKVKVGTEKYMKECGLLSKHANTVCQSCISYVESYLINKKRKLENVPQDDVENVIKHVLTLNDDSLAKVASAIGERISSSIYEDSVSLKDSYKDINFLNNLSIGTWIQGRNKTLTCFLMSAAGCLSTVNAKKMRYVSNAIDSLYKARHLNFVAPLPFCNNLLTYYICGSKLVTKINNRQQAAGSYSCLKSWLLTVSKTPCKMSDSGDVITFFDNSQVVARNWRVNYQYKSQASVITTLLHIAPNLPNTIQACPNLCPTQWLHNLNNTADVAKHIQEIISDGEKSYDCLRNTFLGKRLTEVLHQTRRTERGFTDTIEDTIAGVYGPFVQTPSDDPYSWVDSRHLETAPTMKVGEPAMKNPCSYESVKAVFKHVQELTLNNGRLWTVVGCDGLPYVLGNRILNDNRDFNNLLLVPGLGHIEINATKACFKLLWEPCLQDLSKMLGYRTPRAQLCCQLCTDHHKAWMILKIFLFSTMDEILSYYIRNSLSNFIEPSVAGLYDFISKSGSKNFRFMCDATFNIVLPLFMFRCGVRRNNHMYINAGMSKFCKLFYGFNMTFYQELMFYHMKTKVLAPSDVINFLQKTESFTKSGHLSKGEGGDFILEAINRKIKRWLPPGIPTHHQWTQICRNLDKLDEIRKNTSQEMNMSSDYDDNAKGPYQRDTSTEIRQWRTKLRSSAYLSNTENNVGIHTSVDGQTLDRGLLSFETQCSMNMNKYIQKTSDGSKPGKGLALIPVFTTESARVKFHAIENKTKKQISELIQEGISVVRNNGDIQESVVLDTQWQSVKVRTKNDMLQFYKEVVAAVENSTAVESEEDDDDDDDDDDSDVEEDDDD